MWIKICIVLVVIAVGIAGFLYMHQRQTAALDPLSCAALPSPAIVAFGDSLVYGYGAATPGGFVSQLSTRLGAQITNQGVNGNTTADALARVDTVIAQQPKIVIVLLGGNDALQKVPVSETTKNLDTIITRLQDAHITVVLAGVLGGIGIDPYSGMFSQLAKSHNVSYIPNVLSGLIGNNTYMSDEVHPNDAGYAKIADRIYPVLISTCARINP